MKTLLALLSLLLLPAAVVHADVPGSQDHPLVTRYPGSEITWYDVQEFEPYSIAVGPVTGYRKIDDWKKVEGRVTRIAYELAGERSFYEVYANYLQALKKGGFRILAEGFEKTGKRGGAIGHRTFLEVAYGQIGLPTEARALVAGSATSGGCGYVAAELARDEGPVHVVVGVAQHSKDTIAVVVDVIEGHAMEDDLVTVDAAAMAKGIEAEGSIALYGIFFDHDKATLQAESDPTLKEIAALLTNQPEMNVYIVGHTDGVGALDYNRRLSGQRAQAVVDALVSRHGIDAGRLGAHGVGPLVPVASNASEAGRARNRRVELVER